MPRNFLLRSGKTVDEGDIPERYRLWAAQKFGLNVEDPGIGRDVNLVKEFVQHERNARLFIELLECAEGGVAGARGLGGVRDGAVAPAAPLSDMFSRWFE
jgi:hypothetical protein